MKPTISIIVITYNQEETIGRTLDSILMQQCHVPYEIVIGEDCSTDTTLAWLFVNNMLTNTLASSGF